MDPQLILIQNEIEQMPAMIKIALAEYTHHVTINKELRAKSLLTDDLQNLLNNIDLAFSLVTPLERDIKVYRGIKDTSSYYQDDLGFVSTAIDPKISEPFVGSGCCLLIITVPAGSSVLRIPASVGVYGDESEVLLFRGGTFVDVQNPTGDMILPGIKTFEIQYIQPPLSYYRPALIQELHKYMRMNKKFFEFFDAFDLEGFKKFITPENCYIMFRCIVGNMTLKKNIKPFLKIIMAMFPGVVSEIAGLYEYLDGYGIVEERVDRLYEFEYKKLPEWLKMTVKSSFSNTVGESDVASTDLVFLKMCEKGGMFQMFFKQRILHAYDDIAIRIASKSGQLTIVKFLTEKGAIINTVDNEAIRRAAANGHLDVVIFLADQGADIHAKYDQALRFSAANGHLDVVRFLISRGADVGILDNEAIRLASKNGHLEVVKELVSHT
jgi:hypothetical protein